MQDQILIQMMGSFAVMINGQRVDQTTLRGKKTQRFIQYLILNRGKPVSNWNLVEVLWEDEENSNPENALKTLVSRLRVQMNNLVENFGTCIVTCPGGYQWISRPNVSIDMYELQDRFDELGQLAKDDAEQDTVWQRIVQLYNGDLLLEDGQEEWNLGVSTRLHASLLEAGNKVIRYYETKGDYEAMEAAARAVLRVDKYDENMHIALMKAMVMTDRIKEAMAQYRHATQLSYEELGVEPSQELQEFYRKIVQKEKEEEFSLKFVQEKLEHEDSGNGAFTCEFPVFCDVYNLYKRLSERSEASVACLVAIHMEWKNADMETNLKNDDIEKLMLVLRRNLRRGDAITRISSTIVAVLLSMVDVETSKTVMHRIIQRYYEGYPEKKVNLEYCIGTITND